MKEFVNMYYLIRGSHDSGFLVMMQYSFVDGSQLIACSVYFVPFILCMILSVLHLHHNLPSCIFTCCLKTSILYTFMHTFKLT
jgi:hypothetical protein